MTDLSKPLPLGLNRRNWPYFAVAFVALIAFLAPLDHLVSESLQAWPQPYAGVFAGLTGLGLSEWVLVPSLALFIIFGAMSLALRERPQKLAARQMAGLWAFVFAGVALPGLATNILKRIIGRARPVVFDENGPLAFHNFTADWQFQSFPSGHSTTIFAFAFVVGFLWPRLFWPAIVLALAVGVSRVVVGMHYPTDVLGGMVMGTLGAYAVRYFFARRRWVFTIAENGAIAPRRLMAIRRVAGLPPPQRLPR
ncbi:phosphatase PAP2 family protein [Youhaiella tibetensis]|uniref:Phosphatase PAP2 family protein n=1 Tax=Paradevosia tibetensis TaxID=1447062 RepID=A0A5B9DQG4_9HYPH|nr:phosphatase PAP2 family protein [Youhaiella tibetensis]QEE20808.1 phosphatase PAP2 family protein [Youhaiella tibetensis]